MCSKFLRDVVTGADKLSRKRALCTLPRAPQICPHSAIQIFGCDDCKYSDTMSVDHISTHLTPHQKRACSSRLTRAIDRIRRTDRQRCERSDAADETGDHHASAGGLDGGHCGRAGGHREDTQANI